MSLWKRLFGKKDADSSLQGSGEAASIPPATTVEQPADTLLTGNGTPPATLNRRIRVFISSTFRDMIAERDELMTHTWPELRQLCQQRNVELVEVDLRWGISEEQSTRRETLKLCLDEIRDCRPFFIGLLGERYGWMPGNDAFTADLTEEEPWLKDIHDKSVTELEILHGVLNNPDIAGRAFFYFRDPVYTEGARRGFPLGHTAADAGKQTALKARSATPARRRGFRSTKIIQTRWHSLPSYLNI